MFCGKTRDKKMEQIPKRSSRLLYNEPHMALEKLLIHDQGIRFHHKYANTLLTEIYKPFQGRILIS